MCVRERFILSKKRFFFLSVPSQRLSHDYESHLAHGGTVHSHLAHTAKRAEDPNRRQFFEESCSLMRGLLCFNGLFFSLSKKPQIHYHIPSSFPTLFQTPSLPSPTSLPTPSMLLTVEHPLDGSTICFDIGEEECMASMLQRASEGLGIVPSQWAELALVDAAGVEVDADGMRGLSEGDTLKAIVNTAKLQQEMRTWRSMESETWMKTLPEVVWLDPEFSSYFMRRFRSALRWVDGDRARILLSFDAQRLRYCPTEVKADREVCLAAVSEDGLLLKYCSKELQEDRELCLAAVTKNGRALEYCSTFRSDYELCSAAVLQNRLALHYCSKDTAVEIVFG